MGGRLPDRRDPVPRFGAAAGYTHPATGFSVAASLRAAPRVAATLATADRGDGLGRRLAAVAALDPAPPRLRAGGAAAPRPGRAGDVLRHVLRPARRGLGAVPAHRRVAAGGQPDDDDAAASTASGAAAAAARRAAAWRVLIDLRTASTQPTADGGGEDEPLHGVGQVRPVGQVGERERLRVRPAPPAGPTRSARRTSARPRRAAAGRAARCRRAAPPSGHPSPASLSPPVLRRWLGCSRPVTTTSPAGAGDARLVERHEAPRHEHDACRR